MRRRSGGGRRSKRRNALSHRCRRAAHDIGGFEIVELARNVLGQFGWRAVEHHAPLGHADQAVAIAARQVERMQVAEHGDAEVLVDAQQRIHHNLGVAGIERGDRLVGEDDVGLLHQRAGDRDALLLAAGELVGALGCERGNIELLKRGHRQRLVLLGPGLRQRAPGRHRRKPSHQDVGENIEPADQIELLKDHRRARPPLPQLLAAQRRDVEAVEQDAALRRGGETVDGPQQGRLAGAGPSDHADEAAGRDLKRGVVHRGFHAEATRQTFNHQHAGLQSSWDPPLTPALDTCVTRTLRCGDTTHLIPCSSPVIAPSRHCQQAARRETPALSFGCNMAAKALSVQPTVDPSAKLHEAGLGAYTEVGARTMLHEVTMGDYSYVVNDAQITYTTIGKFCSIAAMTRINPGNHPMHRATQAHFTYRSSAYFEGESDDTEFFDWRRQHHVHIGHDVWIGHGAIALPGRNIGTGAVIAAGAIVTKDVPAYTIVAGNPARIVRRRFSEEVAGRLASLAWWDWDHDKLRAALPDFRKLGIEDFLSTYEARASSLNSPLGSKPSAVA